MQKNLYKELLYQKDIQMLENKARSIRAICIKMAHDGKEGHLNGALSCVDLLVGLYYTWLKVTPDDLNRKDKDRFIFSKGHACSSLYAVMADRGFFPKHWISSYAQNDSPLPSHPCIHALPILECSSGSLGHGLGMATGMSYGLRMDGIQARVAVLISDGECNEGSTWEAATFAVANRLDNLLLIVDNNGIQSVGLSDKLMGFTSLEEKYNAFGWTTRMINGNNITEIVETLKEFPFEKGRPSAIIAKTVAGAGVSFMENQVLWHYRVPSDEDLKKAMQELSEVPFYTESNA